MGKSNRVQNAKKNLKKRQKAFDESGHKPGDGHTRPGSHSGRK
jgi:hypothetical protein